MGKNVPETIYGRWENEGTEDEFLLTAEDPSEIAFSDDGVEAGEYVLKQKVKIINKTEIQLL